MARLTDKNKYGQYMTPAQIAELMIAMSTAKAKARVLEPSAGEGVFVKLLGERFQDVAGYEFDPELARLNKNVRNKSFLSVSSEKKYDLIIGNPPYIRWKNLEPVLKKELAQNKLWQKHCNSLCDYSAAFILQSVEMLKERGELIFITPEYWVNTTHSIGMRNYLVENGYFTDIIQFSETPIFAEASVALIIFRYIKDSRLKSKPDIRVRRFLSNKKLNADDIKALQTDVSSEKVINIQTKNFKKNQRWILADQKSLKALRRFEKACVFPGQSHYSTLAEVCDIGNGLVSGLDQAFQFAGEPAALKPKEQRALLSVCKAKDLQPYFGLSERRYMFLESVRTEAELKKNFPHFYKKLLPFKAQLLQRYDYGRELKYWQWAFLRNYKLFSSKQKRIFVPCKERISNKEHFRFALMDSQILPTQDVTALFVKPGAREDIHYILAFLNQRIVFDWLKLNGITKGNIVEFSEKPLAGIPVRRIDFKNPQEVKAHTRIVDITQKIMRSQNLKLHKELEAEFKALLT